MKLRVGQSVGRTLYLQDGDEPAKTDELVGMVDHVWLAMAIVASFNQLERVGSCPGCGFPVHLEQSEDSRGWGAVEQTGKVHRCSGGVRLPAPTRVESRARLDSDCQGCGARLGQTHLPTCSTRLGEPVRCEHGVDRLRVSCPACGVQ